MNNGVARISSRALLQSSGKFVNNGVLDLLTATGEIPTNLINNGTITLRLITYAGYSYQLQHSSSLTTDS